MPAPSSQMPECVARERLGLLEFPLRVAFAADADHDEAFALQDVERAADAVGRPEGFVAEAAHRLRQGRTLLFLAAPFGPPFAARLTLSAAPCPLPPPGCLLFGKRPLPVLLPRPPAGRRRVFLRQREADGVGEGRQRVEALKVEQASRRLPARLRLLERLALHGLKLRARQQRAGVNVTLRGGCLRGGRGRRRRARARLSGRGRGDRKSTRLNS